MRGRRPVGPELVDRLPGSESARERVKVVLQTMTGELRVQEACEQLQISEQRFDELRIEAIQAAVASLEPKPMGRPVRKTVVDAAEMERLQQRVAELEAQVAAAVVRAELATALPKAGRDLGKR
jgi:tetrahydromethanopterin S-methyltransferase subunit G